MRAYREEIIEMSATDSLDHAQLQAEELLEELQTWSGGLEGTNLENSQKYTDLIEASKIIKGINWKFLDIMDVKVAVHVLKTRRKKRRIARWARLHNVIAHLRAVVDTMPEQDFSNDIEVAIGELESVKIPGMYS